MHHTLFINGEWVSGNGAPFESINPANNDVLWRGESADQQQIELAIHAARKAQPHWEALALQQRLSYLKKFVENVSAQREVLAETISAENGKPLWDARTEIGAVINKLDLTVQAQEQRAKDSASFQEGIDTILRYRALGVAAVFGPFNFPCHLANGHIMPALLMGNTVVLKPSELTPMCSHKIIECWEKTGIPKGVINLIQGGREVGEMLSKQPLDALLFTGSYAVGKKLHQQLGGHPQTLLALEMGGNNPLVVFNVADHVASALITIQSAFVSAGQRCTCARRLIVQRGESGDVFLQALIDMTKKLIVGPATQQPEPFMGPLISTQAVQHVLDRQTELMANGATALLEAKKLRGDSAFISAGIIDVTDIRNISDEEVFGPLLQVYRVDTFDEAIDLANRTRFGLSAGLLSDDQALFNQFSHLIRAGILNWNRPLTGASSAAPFGGFGCSGNHRPSGFLAIDSTTHPVATMAAKKVQLPSQLPAGVSL